MAEYIEREIAIKHLENLFQLQRVTAMAIIESIPTADVAPVRHGRWHSRFYYRESTKAYDCEMHVCSECGSEWSYDAETGSSDFNYCPNCGAKMDGGDTSERQAMAVQSQKERSKK